MLQTAVFVDAGYLHAQGSALLAGQRQPRHRHRLNVPAVLADLIAEAAIVGPGRLLRIYWYDGVARGGVLNQEQTALAQSDDVKCRFGVINSRGQQKGVDSLIVTDLIQLAREHAFSDALILAGDEDLRVGVQVAQTFGIRVHLLGIHPARGSQSPDLIAEADTTREWDRAKVAAWLALAPEQITNMVPAAIDVVPQPAAVDVSAVLGAFAVERATAVAGSEIDTLLAYVNQNRGSLPSDFDRPALGAARDLIGRDLAPGERKDFRNMLRDALRAQAAIDCGGAA